MAPEHWRNCITYTWKPSSTSELETAQVAQAQAVDQHQLIVPQKSSSPGELGSPLSPIRNHMQCLYLWKRGLKSSTKLNKHCHLGKASLHRLEMSAISVTPPCKEIKLLQLDVIFIHAVYFCFQPVISNYCLCLTPGWQQQQKLNSPQTHLVIVCCAISHF